MRIYILLTLLALTGCMTAEKYTKAMSGWNGRNIKEVMMQMGPPQSTFDLPDGTKSYTWLQQSAHTSTYSYNQFSRNVQQTSSSRYCKVTYFTNTINIIENVRWEGNSCH